MTVVDHAELEALNVRLDHTAAIAHLVSRHLMADAYSIGAVEGIAATLDELSERLERVAVRLKATQ